MGVFRNAGFSDFRKYKYWNAEKRNLDLEGARYQNLHSKLLLCQFKHARRSLYCLKLKFF